MKVVFLSTVGALGGAERVLLTLLQGVRAACPHARLHLLAGSDGPLLDQASELGVGVKPLPLPAALGRSGDSALRSSGGLHWLKHVARPLVASTPAVLSYVRRLRREIQQLGPDLVHANGFKMHVLGALATPPAAKLAWHLHDFCTPRPVMARALRGLASRADAAIAVSRAVAEDARGVLGGLPVEVVPNAVDLQRFSPGHVDGALLDRLAGLPPAADGTLRIGLVATFARWKGQEIFLQAAAQLQRQQTGPALRFFVVGGPIYETIGSQFSKVELQCLAEKLGLARCIGFIGFQADTVPIYRALDVVVQASTQPEPFGLTIAEAMACGRPVVVSRAGGAGELFEHDHDALGVAPADAAALAGELRRLCSSPELRARLGFHARRSAEARFDADRYKVQLLAVYQQMLGSPANLHTTAKIPRKTLTANPKVLE